MPNSANVLVALTGSVLTAPVGTTAPANATMGAGIWTTASALWRDLGYISEDGISEEHDDESAEIKAWQNGDVVRRMITGSSAQYQLTLIETTASALGLYYKGSTLVGTGPINGPATLSVKSPTADIRAFGIDIIDGSHLERLVIPRGEVTERGPIEYKNDESRSYELTITAYPAAGSQVHTVKYFSALAGIPAAG